MTPVRNHIGYCEDKKRLQNQFLESAHELNTLLNRQMEAVIEGEPDFTRFDELIQQAQARKEMAKYAWIGHVDAHHCEEG